MTATSATSTFRFRTAILGLALALLVGTLGCSRKSYRLRADADAFGLIEQKTSNPRWLLEDYHVYPDPRSRMASPNSPDFPPMPPDDPDSHELMKCVDGKRGFKGWDRWGETPYVANPQWRSFVPTDGEGKLPLNRNSAVRAALLNSPAYQSELEDLYLSALDVSFERFRFDAQFFGGYQAFLSASGRRHPDGQSSQLALATRNPSGSALEMHKLFAGGGELVVGFANSLIWEFSGPNRHTASTILDFSLIQPLLRGGGRAQRVGAADGGRACTVGKRSADGTISPGFLYGDRCRVGSGRRAGTARWFVGRLRSGRILGRRCWRIRPVGEYWPDGKCRTRRHGWRTGRRFRWTVADAAGVTESADQHRRAARTARLRCKPNTTRAAGSTSFRSSWHARRCTTRRADCSHRKPATSPSWTTSRSTWDCRPICRWRSTIPCCGSSTCWIRGWSRLRKRPRIC